MKCIKITKITVSSLKLRKPWVLRKNTFSQPLIFHPLEGSIQLFTSSRHKLRRRINHRLTTNYFLGRILPLSGAYSGVGARGQLPRILP